jgi:hypothetical protein
VSYHVTVNTSRLPLCATGALRTSLHWLSLTASLYTQVCLSVVQCPALLSTNNTNNAPPKHQQHDSPSLLPSPGQSAAPASASAYNDTAKTILKPPNPLPLKTTLTVLSSFGAGLLACLLSDLVIVPSSPLRPPAASVPEESPPFLDPSLSVAAQHQ